MICCSAQRSVRNASRSFSFLQKLATGCAILETDNLAVFMVSERETTRLPVRSALFKQRTGGLVVRWVITSEYPLLYVFDNFFAPTVVNPFDRPPASLKNKVLFASINHDTEKYVSSSSNGCRVEWKDRINYNKEIVSLQRKLDIVLDGPLGLSRGEPETSARVLTRR